MMIFDFEQEKKEVETKAALRKAAEEVDMQVDMQVEAGGNISPARPSVREIFQRGVSSLILKNKITRAFKLPEYLRRRNIFDLAISLLDCEADLSHS
jgi:hypothetical protein